MNRLSFSRQPSVWIGLISAAVAFAAVLGLHAPQGFEAAAAGVATAIGAAVTWTQVRPAKQSVTVDPDAAVVVHEPADARGVTTATEYRLIGGQVRQTGAVAEIADVPVKAHPRTTGGYESSARKPSDLKPPRPGPAPGAKKTTKKAK